MIRSHVLKFLGVSGVFDYVPRGSSARLGPERIATPYLVKLFHRLLHTGFSPAHCNGDFSSTTRMDFESPTNHSIT
jgi:hypothetical protein